MAVKTGTKLGLVALALAVGAAVFWFYLTAQVSLPDDRTGFVVAFLTAAALGVFSYFKGTSVLGAVPPTIAIFIGLLLPFTIYISPQSLETSKVIVVGDTIPRFTAPDGRGQTFDSAELNGHLVLIKFFRAHW
ncbi:MAG: hypothetical protein AAGA91_15100 [Pseudomonadota bacterium]